MITKEVLFLLDHQKYITTQELKDAGLSYYRIQRLVESNQLRKLNRFSYENQTIEQEESEYASIFLHVRQGVLCLWSAASYHGLSDVRISQHTIAIPSKARISTLPEWPPIKLVYITKERFELGRTTMSEADGSFAIYDREKTVCDLLLHRNKTSLEDVLSALKTYLSLPDRDIPKLIRYAKQLRCYSLLKQYLEVLL